MFYNNRKQVNSFHLIGFIFTVGLISCLQSCVIVSKSPKDYPFVYKTTIQVQGGEFTPAERKDFISKLENQIDDSLKMRSISYVGIQVVKNPPRFDTANITRSKTFMRALMVSQGYFHPRIDDSFHIVTEKRKKKTFIKFKINTGLLTRFDSVGYALTTPSLQNLALQYRKESLLKVNAPYSIQSISEERDRLIKLFHENGYFKIGLDDVYAEVDTVLTSLIDPMLDPFEQIKLLDSLRKKSERPTIHVVIKQRAEADSNHLKQFQMGNISIYPDQSMLQDSIIHYDTTRMGEFLFLTNSNRFKLPFMTRYIYLKPGQQYNEKNYYRTINQFRRLGAWQSVDLILTERTDTLLPTLDGSLKLYPALKHNSKIDLEASRNIADYLTTSQFFGLGLNVAFANRNAFKQSIQTNSNARFGVELGTQNIQTLQTNLSHTIVFPKLITPFRVNPEKSNIANERTLLNLNGSYTIRKDIYNVTSLNSSWGYEWSTKRFNWQFIPINVEFTQLEKKDSLDKLILRIPSLRFAFNDGFVIGMIGSMSTGWSKRNHFSNFKIRMEESGAIFGLVRSLENNNLFRYLKADIEYKHYINYSRSQLAFRIFSGIGYVYGKKNGEPERNLPFFKAYFAGGPYSMRAWQVRRLGPGSTSIYDTASNSSNDRFGNIQLEANFEYRFDLTTVAGVKVKSALFTDIGNIWSNEYRDINASSKIKEASFSLSRLGRDLAIGSGASIRFDFDFFLIRLDWAYKVKNPIYYQINNGWFHQIKLSNGQFQLGINVPF